MSRALVIALVMPLCLVLLGGCGDSGRLSYERDLAKVGRGVEKSLETLPQDDTQTIGPAQLSKLASDLREAADQLSDLEPPKDVADAQRRLERGLNGVATGFDELSSDLAAAEDDQSRSDLFVRFQADPEVDAAFEDILGAQEAFARKGYRVFRSEPVKTTPPA